MKIYLIVFIFITAVFFKEFSLSPLKSIDSKLEQSKNILRAIASFPHDNMCSQLLADIADEKLRPIYNQLIAQIETIYASSKGSSDEARRELGEDLSISISRVHIFAKYYPEFMPKVVQNLNANQRNWYISNVLSDPSINFLSHDAAKQLDKILVRFTVAQELTEESINSKLLHQYLYYLFRAISESEQVGNINSFKRAVNFMNSFVMALGTLDDFNLNLALRNMAIIMEQTAKNYPINKGPYMNYDELFLRYFSRVSGLLIQKFKKRKILKPGYVLAIEKIKKSKINIEMNPFQAELIYVLLRNEGTALDEYVDDIGNGTARKLIHEAMSLTEPVRLETVIENWLELDLRVRWVAEIAKGRGDLKEQFEYYAPALAMKESRGLSFSTLPKLIEIVPDPYSPSSKMKETLRIIHAQLLQDKALYVGGRSRVSVYGDSVEFIHSLPKELRSFLAELFSSSSMSYGVDMEKDLYKSFLKYMNEMKGIVLKVRAAQASTFSRVFGKNLNSNQASVLFDLIQKIEKSN